jgi:hypothetical protein
MATSTKQSKTSHEPRPLNETGRRKSEADTGSIDCRKGGGRCKRASDPGFGSSNPRGEGNRVAEKRGRQAGSGIQRSFEKAAVDKTLWSGSTSKAASEVSALQKTYKAIWKGILSDERIEEECRWIEKLFRV